MRILYIDIDCCRADHLGCNGYFRDTSPNIDRIASEGVSFTNCHTSNSPCLPSRAALFTGGFGINNGIVSHHGVGERLRPNSASHSPDPAKPFFVHHIARAGMKTAAFSSFHDRHNAWWWTAGWNEVHTNPRGGQETAEEIAEPALAWLAANGEADDWMIDVHFWDAHSHYRVPDEWLKKYWNEPGPEFPDAAAVERNLDIYGPRSGRDLYTGYENDERPNDSHPEGVRTVDDAKRLIDMYDGSIAYVDHQVGRIVDLLAKQGVLEDTAIVISADHGDSFGEHGQYMDHGIANTAVHNIPLIVRWPGAAGRGLNDGLVYQLDLGPTVCDMLRLRTPGEWDGESFAAALQGDGFEGRPYLVYDHGIYTLSRAVRTKDWTLIDMLHPGLYPYESPFYLHDLSADYHTQTNLYPERRDKLGELAGYLAEWKHEQVRNGCSPDPLEAMVTTGPFIYYGPGRMDARLRATGREKQADELQARLALVRQDWCARFG